MLLGMGERGECDNGVGETDRTPKSSDMWGQGGNSSALAGSLRKVVPASGGRRDSYTVE